MASHKSFAVIGLGRFGTSVATTLCELGHEVLAVDHDADRVAAVADSVTHAVHADTTDERALRQLGIRNFDAVIISVGDDIRSSILSTVLCKELGAPRVIAKAADTLHAKLLTKTGADAVVLPEREAGVRLARSLVNENILDYLELSDTYSINEVVIPAAWVGRSILDINVRKNFGLSIVAIRRDGGIIVTFDINAPLKTGDVLVMVGANSDFMKIKG